MAHSKEIVKFSEGDYQGIFAAMLEALKEAGFGVKESDAAKGYIKAVAGFNLASYGENIELFFKQAGNRTEIKIRSACVSPTQVIDFGKNEKNVKKIFEAFGKRVKLADS
jgi:hypothetical protein